MPLSKEALQYAPWSYTMANVAHICPFHFHQKYIVRAKSEETVRIDSEVGIAVHQILDWCIRGVTVDAAYSKAVQDLNLTYAAEIAIHNYRTAIEEFLQGLIIFRKKQQVIRVESEKRIGITQDFSLTQYKATDCFIRGAIDLTLFTKNKCAVIIDHKSGTRKKLDTYSNQMAIYALLINAIAPDIDSIRTAVHYVGANKNKKGTRTEWGPEYPIEIVQTRFRENIIIWLNDAARAIQTMDTKKSWLCNFCGYRYLCPQYKGQ
ncbi:MAG: PD-(D/E)XK nuclease family protein [Desulfobacteraceae bacterium]